VRDKRLTIGGGSLPSASQPGSDQEFATSRKTARAQIHCGQIVYICILGSSAKLGRSPFYAVVRFNLKIGTKKRTSLFKKIKSAPGLMPPLFCWQWKNR
jgi:hypothetical protein